VPDAGLPRSAADAVHDAAARGVRVKRTIFPHRSTMISVDVLFHAETARSRVPVQAMRGKRVVMRSVRRSVKDAVWQRAYVRTARVKINAARSPKKEAPLQQNAVGVVVDTT